MTLDVEVRRFDSINAIAASPDGSLIAFAVGDRVHVRTALNGDDQAAIAARASDLVFSADGCLAMRTADGILVVDPIGAELCRVDEPQFANLRSSGPRGMPRMAWDPDGSLVAVTNSFELWRIAIAASTVDQAIAPGGDRLRATAVFFLSDGRMLTVDGGWVYAHGPGEQLAKWHTHSPNDTPPTIRSAVVLGGDRVLVHDETGAASLLEIRRDGIDRAAPPDFGDHTYVDFVGTADGDGLLVQSSTLERWDTEPFVKVASTATGPRLATSGGGRIVASDGNEVTELDADLNTVASMRAGAGTNVWDVAFAGSRLLIGSGDAVTFDGPDGERVLSTTDFFDEPIDGDDYGLRLAGSARGDASVTVNVKPAGPDSRVMTTTTVMLPGTGSAAQTIETGAVVRERVRWTADGAEVWGLSPTGDLFCVDAATGVVRTIDLPACDTTVEPVFVGDEVVVLSRDAELVIVDRRTEEVRLVETGLAGPPRHGPMVAVGRSVRLIDSRAGALVELALDGSDRRVVCELPSLEGRRVWTISPDGRRLLARSGTSEDVIVVNDDGKVVGAGQAPVLRSLAGSPEWSDDGHCAWVGADGSIVIVDTEGSGPIDWQPTGPPSPQVDRGADAGDDTAAGPKPASPFRRLLRRSR